MPKLRWSKLKIVFMSSVVASVVLIAWLIYDPGAGSRWETWLLAVGVAVGIVFTEAILSRTEPSPKTNKVVCFACEGSGKLSNRDVCPMCDGSGHLRRLEIIYASRRGRQTNPSSESPSRPHRDDNPQA